MREKISKRKMGKERKQTHLGVTLLDLTGLLGEDDKASLVLLEALNVELQRLLRLVAAAVVDGDTDREGLLTTDTGGRELGGGETTAGTELAVVADGGGADGGAEELSGPVKVGGKGEEEVSIVSTSSKNRSSCSDHAVCTATTPVPQSHTPAAPPAACARTAQVNLITSSTVWEVSQPRCAVSAAPYEHRGGKGSGGRW